MDLNILHLIFSLTIDGTGTGLCNPIELSRRFPDAFREVTCGRATPCADCTKPSGCVWFSVFSQQLSTNPEAVRRHQKPSLPFVFGTPFLLPAEKFSSPELSLTLVGSAVNHAGDFIRGIERFIAVDGGGENNLDEIYTEGVYGERSFLTMTKRGEVKGDLRILAADEITGKSVGDNDTLSLAFITPYRQFQEGRLLRNFDCSVFLRGIIRRVSSLVAAYGDGKFDDDFKALADLSKGIALQQNQLVFTPGNVPGRGGIVGSVRLYGNLAPFLPYLLLGEYLHAGKGASWGYGRYQLIMDK